MFDVHPPRRSDLIRTTHSLRACRLRERDLAINSPHPPSLGFTVSVNRSTLASFNVCYLGLAPRHFQARGPGKEATVTISTTQQGLGRCGTIPFCASANITITPFR